MITTVKFCEILSNCVVFVLDKMFPICFSYCRYLWFGVVCFELFTELIIIRVWFWRFLLLNLMVSLGKMRCLDGVYQKAKTLHQMVPRAWGELCFRAGEVAESVGKGRAEIRWNGYDFFFSSFVLLNFVKSTGESGWIVQNFLLQKSNWETRKKNWVRLFRTWGRTMLLCKRNSNRKNVINW